MAGAILSACSSQESSEGGPPGPKTIPVRIAQARLQDVPRYFDSIGTLQPLIKVDVRPQVSGMLREVHFSEGQNVKKGDPLFAIDSGSYAIKLQEAEANLAQDSAKLDAARKKLDRFSSLSKKDLIPQIEWDDLQFQVATNEAQMRSDQARVAAARLDLERCSIISPIDGRTGRLQVHPGNLVSDSQATPLVTLSNIDPLVVEFTLTENEFQQLKPEHQQGGYPIEICLFCNQTETTQGSLTFLDSAFDEETGLLHLQGKLPNEERRFLPGQHVRVRIPVQVSQNRIVVPQKSVKINQQGPYVFVVKTDNSVEVRQIKLGDEVADDVVVAEGLMPEEKVVTEGHLRLAPGLHVEIK